MDIFYALYRRNLQHLRYCSKNTRKSNVYPNGTTMLFHTKDITQLRKLTATWKKLFQFPYSEPKKIENGLSISEGMITLEELPNGNKKMINRVTEGFVEDVARHMVLEIDPTAEIDKSVYSMRVKFADALVSARDAALGKGSTYAIFLTHSSILKQELESKQVIHNR